MDVKDKVVEIVADNNSVMTADEINSHLENYPDFIWFEENLDMDNSEKLNLIGEIEIEFDISINDYEIENVDTVQGLINLVKEKEDE